MRPLAVIGNVNVDLIVGPVAPGRRGIKNTEGELDAVRGIAYEPSTPMRSPDPEREPVPIAGGARKTAL